MKKWKAMIRKKSSAVVIIFDALIAVGVYFLHNVSLQLSCMVLIFALLLNIGYYFYMQERKQKSKEEEEKKWQLLFSHIEQKKMTKEKILEEDLSLPTREFFEKSLIQPLTMKEYQGGVDAHLPFVYQLTFISLYYLFERNSKEEFHACYTLFQSEIAKQRARKELERQKQKQMIPFLLCFIFVLIFILFLFPYLREILYA